MKMSHENNSITQKKNIKNNKPAHMGNGMHQRDPKPQARQGTAADTLRQQEETEGNCLSMNAR